MDIRSIRKVFSGSTRVYIRTLHNRTIYWDVNLEMLIGDFVRQLTDYGLEDPRLIFSGQQLENCRKLSYYNIKEVNKAV